MNSENEYMSLESADILDFSDSELSTLDESELETPIQTDAFTHKAQDYIDFTYKNPTTYHVIEFFKKTLIENGFTYVQEGESLPQEESKSGLYFSIRSNLSLVAFVKGKKWSYERGVGVVAAHVDSLAIKLKPVSLRKNVDGYEMLGVAPYSGSMNKLWLDRDFGIGGALYYKSGKIVKMKTINSTPHPIAKIPKIAEHFGLDDKLIYNKETQMAPIIGYSNGPADEPTPEESKCPLVKMHPIKLLRYLSKLAEVPLSEIVGFDLELFDVQKGHIGGLNNEFIFAPRIDDRLCSYLAILGLIEFAKTVEIESYDGFNVAYLVNNEEIGSLTRTGAHGKFLNSVLTKFTDATESDLNLIFSNSIILSADVTHALNPNFKNCYLDKNFPVPNVGLTLKVDSNQHVMTDAVGIVVMEEIAGKNGLILQRFHIRNDSRSGGTIGPIMATNTGARVVDVGLPQLSMHSIRAMCGYKEVLLGITTFSAFFKDWREAYDRVEE